MADDTGTDWAAVRLDLLAHAAAMKDNLAEYQRLGDTDLAAACEHSIAMHELAAVGLRRLAQLDTAIGDRQQLQAWLDEHNSIKLRQVIAAVLGSGEQPEPEPVSDESSPYCPCGGSCHRASSPCSLSCVVHHASGCWEQPEGPTTCPTCGSRSPMYAVRTPDNPWGDCTDSWHGEQR